MFIVRLTYLEPVSRIDDLLEEHRSFLRKYYSLGKFVVSGPQVPRTGGVIVADAADLQEMTAILQEDPFWRAEAARYDIVEFTPTMSRSDS
jgi:uncharacterized protein YciI